MSRNEPEIHDDTHGQYAVDTESQPTRIWQYREGVVTSEENWQQVDKFSSDKNIQLELGSAVYRPSGWLYADKLEVTEVEQSAPGRDTSGLNQFIDDQYVVQFVDNDRIVGKNQSEAYAKSVGWLVSNAELHEQIDIPYGLGATNFVLNNKPEHSDGKQMHRDKEVGEGLYLETSVPKERKKNQIEKLADECGLSVMFGGEW